ncbi:MAG TPA: hypothetical protein VHN77_04560 [Phycisphaerales bacterium]|nr:hypothetical protein [Phycisphaerales bacterium]
MSVPERDNVFPEWEPIPWNATGPEAGAQSQGFLVRAGKPLVWMKVDLQQFPADGIFGQGRDWFVRHDIAYVTTFEDEDFVLIQNTWFGFPDPPEWGLASRPTGNSDAKWSMWGHFPHVPKAWSLPDVS